MTNEEKYVVEPLIEWFKQQREKQKANWEVVKKPKHGTSEKGWDLQVKRKNQDLLIEAKYINGPFIGSFSSLVTSPLVNRKQESVKRKYRSWCSYVCWAIGTSRETISFYQALFDYLARNQKFWKHYYKDLSVKYVFIVMDFNVTKISFPRLLDIATMYGKETNGRKRKDKKAIVGKILSDGRDFR